MQFSELLVHPIIQAPMAGVSTPALAAAVSNAGALGSIGIASSTLSAARAMIVETRGLTSSPFNVNVFCHAPARRDATAEAQWLDFLQPVFEEFGARAPVGLNEIYRSFAHDDEAFAMVLALRPPIMSFHFGLPSQDRVNALHEAGIVTFATATNLAEAQRIEAAGIKAIVAQGIEAGGHRGLFDPAAHDPCLSTSVLTRLLVRQAGIPVIAAGGIMDAAGINAAMTLGAAAVQMGTAFVLCPESAADDAYRTALKGPRAHDTQISAAISGRPARGLANRMMELARAGPRIPDYPVAYDASKALHTAAKAKGNDGFAAQWAGQGAPLAREMAAGDLVRDLAGAIRR